MKRRGLRDRKIFTGIFFAVSLAFCIALLAVRAGDPRRWKDGPADGSLEQADGI